MFTPAATDSPAVDYADITPDDSTPLPRAARAIHAGGGAGTVAALSQSGTVCTFYMNRGDTLPIVTVRINSTGTTATGLVALF